MARNHTKKNRNKQAAKPSSNGSATAASAATATAEAAKKTAEAAAVVAAAAVAVYDLTKEDYDKERKSCLELLNENTAQHDKAILTLAAGALGLSVTFLKDIARNPAEGTIWLGLGWFLLIVSLVSMVASFLTGQWACWHQLGKLDKHLQEQKRPPDENYWGTWTKGLNLSAFCCFLVGVASLVFFSWENLERHNEGKKPDALQQTIDALRIVVESLVEQSKTESEMSKPNRTPPTTVKATVLEGLIPPTAPVSPPNKSQFGHPPASAPVNQGQPVTPPPPQTPPPTGSGR